MSRVALAALFIVIAVAFAGREPPPASAGVPPIPNLIFPFPEGQTWTILRGYDCDPTCHNHSQSTYALDFTKDDAFDEPVRAAAAGTVDNVYSLDGINWTVEIDHAGGYFTYYRNLRGVGLVGGGAVAQGQTIGRVGFGETGADPPSIHFSLQDDNGDGVVPEPMCGHSGFLPGQQFTNCFPDADSDGVRNEKDNCPSEAEDRDLYDDQNGCPEPEPDEGLGGDFDGDGDGDVAHICCANWIQTWFSNGNGTYNLTIGDPGGTYNVQSGLWRTGDFNGDGMTDLIHLCCSDYVHVWFSNGDGTYNITQFFPGGGYEVQLGSWQVGDVNGDGMTDLLHLCCGDYIHTWLSNGDGSFSTPLFDPPGTYNVLSGSYRTGDINGDGMTDLIHLCCADYIHTWISNGDGSYDVTPQFTPPGGGAYVVQSGSIYVADGNGDGNADLFHICCDAYIHTWYSNGDGTFDVTSFDPPGVYDVQAGTWKTADPDGDGVADLVHLCCADRMRTWFSNGDGSYQVVPYQPLGTYGMQLGSWRVTDLNGDGRTDLVHRCCPDYVHTWLAEGFGGWNVTLFDPPGPYNVEAGPWLTGDFVTDPGQLPEPTPTPSPTPIGPTPTPTQVGQTPTPTPTATATPTPTATPSGQTPTSTPTAVPGEYTWGDHNCSGDADPIDGLLTLRHDAGLDADTGDCPEFGAALPASGPQLVWGDVDCSGEIDPIDGLKLLRHDAGLSVQQEQGCPLIGTDPS